MEGNMKLALKPPTLTAITILLVMFLPWQAWGDEIKPLPDSEKVLRLEDVERMALEKNPTLAQADALVREAEGRKVQAGLYPNPTLGYAGEEVTIRHPSEKSQHYIFIEQKIITAGKLQRSREIFAQERVKAETELHAQKQRVLNTVRVIFFEG